MRRPRQRTWQQHACLADQHIAPGKGTATQPGRVWQRGLAGNIIQLRRHGVSEISQVPGRPLFASALLSDLGGTSASGHLTLWCYPRKNSCEDSRGVGTNEAQLHGFCDHYLRFTAMVTHGHARLASDCWPGFIGLDWLPTGSLRKVSAIPLPPFPSFAWRNMIYIPVSNHNQFEISRFASCLFKFL